jgi:DNA-binding NtrC family response regulator
MTSVLVVDDDTAVRSATSRFLKVIGLDAEPADSAEAALELLGERPYDLVVTDLQMLGLNGLDLVARVSELSPSTRCILVSGGLKAEDLVRAEALGVVRVLEKPFSFTALASAVGAALGASR